jgi:hypothetical protein
MPRIALLAALSVFLPLWAPALADAPSDKAVIEAWERVQREDTQTIALEPIEPRLYRFATNRFPYDGRLRVLNVSLDGYGWAADGATTMAVVEVELIDATDELYVKHAHSVPMWQATNMLYLDDDTGEWLSNREWQERMIAGAMPGGALSILLSNWFWIGLIGVMIVVLVFVSRKASRQMNVAMNAHEQALSEQQRGLALMEEALALNRQANGTLVKILEALERPGR